MSTLVATRRSALSALAARCRQPRPVGSATHRPPSRPSRPRSVDSAVAPTPGARMPLFCPSCGHHYERACGLMTPTVGANRIGSWGMRSGHSMLRSFRARANCDEWYVESTVSTIVPAGKLKSHPMRDDNDRADGKH